MTKRKAVKMPSRVEEIAEEIIRDTKTVFKPSLLRTDKQCKDLGIELIEYVTHTPDCFSTEYFLNHIKMSSNKFYEWVAASPELKEALESARRIMFERREKGAILGKLNPNTVMPYLHMYSDSYKRAAEWRASLNKEKESEGPQVVVIERFSDPNLAIKASSGTVVDKEKIEVKGEQAS